MTGNKLVAIIAAMIAGGAALAVAGLYIDWERTLAPPAVEQGPAAGTEESGLSPPIEEAAPAEVPEKQSTESAATLTPPSEPTTVPTFDVVVIEPSGEGVIAGRATPGWAVSVQSGGVKVAEAKADLQGEWSVVLEKPLPSGDHALSLKITSPDGTRAVSSQETVRVAVGSAGQSQVTGAVGLPPSAPQAAGSASAMQSAPQAAANAGVTSADAPQTEAAAPPADPNAPRALARSERPAATAPAADGAAAPPPKPKIVFKTVDYVDGGSATGTVTITGTSEPGAKLSVFYDNQPLAEARADENGQWSVQVAKTLSMGQHSFKVERSGAPPGMAGTAFVSIERVEPKPEPPAAAVASKDIPNGQPPQSTANGGTSNPLIYVIRKGDTLWAIAKRYLGSGLRYPAIFQDNREIISNPNLIHPKQEVKVPAAP